MDKHESIRAKDVPDPHAFAQHDVSKFFENEGDIVGHIAFSYLILSVKGEALGKSVGDIVNRCSKHDVQILRDAALNCLSRYDERRIRNRIDQIRTSIYDNTYHEIMRRDFDNLMKYQDEGFLRIREIVAKSSAAWRQMVISVVSSFVFGVIISIAHYMENPFRIVSQELRGEPQVGVAQQQERGDAKKEGQ